MNLVIAGWVSLYFRQKRSRQITATHCLPTTDRRSIFSDRLGWCTVVAPRRVMAILAPSRPFATPPLTPLRVPIPSRGTAPPRKIQRRTRLALCQGEQRYPDVHGNDQPISRVCDGQCGVQNA